MSDVEVVKSVLSYGCLGVVFPVYNVVSHSCSRLVLGVSILESAVDLA